MSTRNMVGVTQNCKIFSRNNITRSITVSSIHPPVDISMKSESIKSFKEIPGPSSLPLIGPLRHFLPGGNLYKMNRKDMSHELYRLYGPIVRLDKLANQPNTVFLYDADSIGTIFRGEESAPRRLLVGSLERYRQKYNKQDYIGVLVNGVGPEWKNFRSPANKAMMNPKLVSESYSKTIDEIAKEVVERLQSVRNEKDMITNFDEELKLWALETTGAVTLGRRLNCFNRELPEDSYEKRLISLIQTAFTYIEAVDLEHNIFKNIVLGQYRKVLDIFTELESVILHFVDQTLKDLESKKNDLNDNEIQSCTIEKILYNNKKAALGVAIDSMVAGVDAVTQSTLFILYFLGTHPVQQEKLREEILSGSDRKSYLKACVKESSRIVPTSFANSRLTTKPYQILGYEIPKDTLIVVPQQVLCMMESHYPRASEFIPERWLVEKEHPMYYGNAHPFAYSPFGFGIRTCIGRRLAQLMMEALVTNMVTNFEIIWEGAPPKITPSTFNKMEGPYRFVFKHRRRLAQLMMEALVTNMVTNFEIIWEGAPPKITPSTFNKMEGPYRFVFKHRQ